MTYSANAEIYREMNHKKDGFVMFDPEGKICGWCQKLDDGSSWRPGVRAQGVNGDVYLSFGGDDQNGAKGWKQVMFVTKKKGRPATGQAKSNAERMKEYRARKAKESDISREKFEELENLRKKNEELKNCLKDVIEGYGSKLLKKDIERYLMALM